MPRAKEGKPDYEEGPRPGEEGAEKAGRDVPREWKRAGGAATEAEAPLEPAPARGSRTRDGRRHELVKNEADKLTVEEVAELQAIASELGEITAERDKLLERLQRATADFLNTEKRLQRQMQTGIRFALEEFLKELLPVFDSLDRAVQAAEQTHNMDAFLEGIKLVLDKWHASLERHGVKALDAEGQKFDPKYHEAVSVTHDPNSPPDAVVAQIDRGYMLRDRVLRPVKVVVNKLPVEVEAAQEAGVPCEEGEEEKPECPHTNTSA